MAVQKNFVVHNGLEVNENLIYANATENKVGINTIYPQATLDVRGGIKTKDLTVTGISTLTEIEILGGVSAGSTTGVKGQYLISTGLGVTWSEPPNVRVVTSRTGNPGQVSFSVDYSVGFLDVYVNGIRLSDTEFTAIDGNTVILDSACFGGESIDFITYKTTSANGLQGISVAKDGIVVGSALSTVLLNFVGTTVDVQNTAGVAATITISPPISTQWVTGVSGIYTGANVGFNVTDPEKTIDLDGIIGFRTDIIIYSPQNYSNIFIGNGYIAQNNEGDGNIFIGGPWVGALNTTGSYNIFIGAEETGYENTTGEYNIFFGTSSGEGNTTGSHNMFLGHYTGMESGVEWGSESSYKILIGMGHNENYFNSPNPTKDMQLAIGLNTSYSDYGSQYWIVGDENFNIGIGTTAPISKMSICGTSATTYDTTKWVASYGDIGIGNSYPTTGSVAVDDLGNSYVIGSYYNIFDTIILSKIDPTGTIVWQYNLYYPESSYYGYGTNVEIDNDNNVCVSLTYGGTYYGNCYGFVVKLDSSGNILWQRVLGDGNSISSLQFTSVGVGSTGNIYTTGFTNYSGEGAEDGVLIKYDPDGNIQYQKTFGTNFTDYGLSIGIGAVSDNIYIGGYTGYDSYGGFVVKFNTDGNLIWQKYVDVGTAEYGIDALVIDSNENVYTISTTDYNDQNDENIHIAKFDTDGNLVWQNVFGGPDTDYVFGGAACDSLNNIYVCGQTYSTGVGYNNLIIFKFDTDGNILWQRTLGVNDIDNGDINQFSTWSDDCIKVVGDRLIVIGYSYYTASIVVASFTTDGDFIGDYGENGTSLYKVKEAYLSVEEGIATVDNFYLVDNTLSLNEAAGSIDKQTLNFTTQVDYKVKNYGHALNVEGFSKINYINPYEIDGNLGIGFTVPPSTKLQVNGVLGFVQYPDGYLGNTTNVLIGDVTTGVNLKPDPPSYSGVSNAFIGAGAGANTVNGAYNNFFGIQAGYFNYDGCYNNFFGIQSGYHNTYGEGNNFLGEYSGYSNTTGYCNNFFGACAGYYNTVGSFNNFFGLDAGYCNTYGQNNNFFGGYAGYKNTGGCYNNFFGALVGYFNTTGCYNVFLGKYTGYFNSTGSYNIFIGAETGYHNTTGAYNIFFGNYVNQDDNLGEFSYKILIGQGSRYNNYFNSPSKEKDVQLAIGIRSDSNPEKYWIVGNENYDIGIGTTNPTSKLEICGNLGFTDNIHIGDSATGIGDSGSKNIIIGKETAQNISGDYNVVLGSGSWSSNISGNENLIFVSTNSTTALDDLSGSNNIFIGTDEVGEGTTSGSYNIFIGMNAGEGNSTGSNNLYLGNHAGVSEVNSFDGSEASYRIIIGMGDLESYINAPDPIKSKQLAIGLNTTGTAEYWLVGDENLNIGIGTTNPTTKLQVEGTVKATAFVGDGSGLTGISVGSGTSQWVTSTSGISTTLNVGIGTTNPQVSLSVVGGSRFGGVFERVSTATTYLSGSSLVLELDCQQATTYTYTLPAATNIGIVSFRNILTQTGVANGTTITVIFTQNATGTGNTTSATGIGTNITVVGYENGTSVAGISTRALVGSGSTLTLSTSGNDVDFVSFYVHYNGGSNTSVGSYKIYATKNGSFR